jgi:dihydropyrimidinase
MKGAINLGSDGDLVIVDMKKEVKVTTDTLHSSAGFTPYEGLRLKGWPLFTVLIGNIVMEEGQIVGKPGIGHVLSRNSIRGKLVQNKLVTGKE